MRTPPVWSRRRCATGSITGWPATRRGADALLAALIERAEDRLRRRENKDVARKSATKRLRLPGQAGRLHQRGDGGDGAVPGGGVTARVARPSRRGGGRPQAVLPLRGKILNVASATVDKLRQNQELRDLVEALGLRGGRPV